MRESLLSRFLSSVAVPVACGGHCAEELVGRPPRELKQQKWAVADRSLRSTGGGGGGVFLGTMHAAGVHPQGKITQTRVDVMIL